MNTHETLKNGFISLSLSVEGILGSLTNEGSGRELISWLTLWRLVVSDAACREIEMIADGVPRLSREGDEIYVYVKSKFPAMGVGIECTADRMPPYTDFTHIWESPELAWNSGWRAKGEFPQMRSADYLFKAAFPEAVISNRNIRDDRDYHSVDDSEVLTNSFLHGDELAVLVTQSHQRERIVSVAVSGFVLKSHDSVRGDATVCGRVLTLPQDSLALLLYARK